MEQWMDDNCSQYREGHLGSGCRKCSSARYIPGHACREGVKVYLYWTPIIQRPRNVHVIENSAEREFVPVTVVLLPPSAHQRQGLFIDGGTSPQTEGLAPSQLKFLVRVNGHLGLTILVITCWFYVKNCIYGRQNFSGPPFGNLSPTAPKMELLEPPLSSRVALGTDCSICSITFDG